MKKNRIFTVIISVMTMVFLFSTLGFTKEEDVGKNETVYVLLNHDGSIKDERVVNRIYGKGDGKIWTDYGTYSEILNMSSEDKPIIKKDEVFWPMTILEIGDFYYQGITDKELPVEIGIKYLLDGREVNGDELAGKSGDLKIIFKVTNKLLNSEPLEYIDYQETQQKKYEEHYTPFLVQISLIANLNIFSDITAEDAVTVVVGEEMNIGFGSYPFPEDEFIVEMKGDNIELDPISITIVPSKIPFLGLDDTEESLTEMVDGVSEMQDGADDIIDGLNEMLEEADKFKSGSIDLAEAISKINHGVYTLNNSSGDIGNGFSELLSGTRQFQEESIKLVSGVSKINKGSSAIGKAIDESASALSCIYSNIGMLSGGLNDIKTNHDNLVAIAQSLVSSDPGNATYQQLLAIAEGEQAALSAVSSGLQGLDSGIFGLSGGFSILSEEYNSFEEGIDQLEDGVGKLPDGIGQLYDGQRQLCDGWNQYSDAVAEIYNGTQTLYDETKGFPADVKKLIDGIKEIRDGLHEFNDEGIIELKEGVIDNVNTVKESKALENKLNELANNYNSFMDNERNINSSVQFIMQTQAIKIEVPDTIKIENNEDQNLWQKIISFFKK